MHHCRLPASQTLVVKMWLINGWGYAKRCPMSLVVVIPKEGWTGNPSILLLVWHRLSNFFFWIFFCQVGVIPKEGWTTTQDIRDLFAYRSPNNSNTNKFGLYAKNQWGVLRTLNYFGRGGNFFADFPPVLFKWNSPEAFLIQGDGCLQKTVGRLFYVLWHDRL